MSKHTPPSAITGTKTKDGRTPITNHQRPLSERKYATVNNEKSKTQQHHSNDCNVNTIMEKYSATGILKNSGKQIPNFADQTSQLQYIDALQLVIDAEAEFNSLPAQIRARFKNSPAEYLDFFSDEANLPEAQKLGLVPSPPKEPAHSGAPAPAAPAPAPLAQPTPSDGEKTP